MKCFAALFALALTGCAGQDLMPVPQPTPVSVAAVQVQLAAISADPAMVWADGDYEVRAACHAYLNAAAQRSANLSITSGGLGIAGPAAAGFLAAGGNPIGAAAAGSLAALGQGFLGLYSASGAIPYTSSTATVIEHALNAYEIGVALSPPTTTAQAMSFVDDLWFECSPGGYAQLSEQAISTAQIGTATAAPMAAAFQTRALGLAVPSPRPVITVNGR